MSDPKPYPPPPFEATNIPGYDEQAGVSKGRLLVEWWPQDGRAGTPNLSLPPEFGPPTFACRIRVQDLSGKYWRTWSADADLTMIRELLAVLVPVVAGSEGDGGPEPLQWRIAKLNAIVSGSGEDSCE